MTEPILMLLGVNLAGMASMPIWFWRLRFLERTVKTEQGVLKAHRYVSRRSLLLAVWWQDGGAAQRWLQHRTYLQFERLARHHTVAGFWVDLYRLEDQVRRYGPGGASHS